MASPTLASSSTARPTLRPSKLLLELFRPEGREIRTLILFSTVIGLLTLVTPLAVESLVNTVAFVGLLQPIVVLAIVMLTCLGLAAILLAMEAYLVELIQRRLFARVVSTLMRRLPRTQGSALDGDHGPELANRFFELPILQKVGAKLLLDGLTVVLSAAVGLIVLAFYHPLLLAFGLVLVALLGVVVFVVGRGAVPTALDESSAKYRNGDWAEQLLRHTGVFRSGRGTEFAAQHGDALATEYLERRSGHYRLLFRQLAGALMLQAVMSTLLMGLGGWLVTINQLTLGQLVAAWLIVGIVLSAVTKLGAQLESFYDILASSKKLGVLLELPTVRDNGQPLPGRGPLRLGLSDLRHPRIAGGRRLQANLEPGQSLAVLGGGGSGKSTLVEVLMGQRDPEAGFVEVDAVHLSVVQLDSLREQSQVVLSGDVFAGSVLDNLLLGRDDVDLDRIREALEAVGLWDQVQRLPDALDCQLSSGGAPLSSSQADQLVLARALIAQPRLLVIDGVLDRFEGEQLRRLNRFLHDPQAPWTLVLATQRSTIAASCDAVLPLDAEGGRRSASLQAVPTNSDSLTEEVES